MLLFPPVCCFSFILVLCAFPVRLSLPLYFSLPHSGCVSITSDCKSFSEERADSHAHTEWGLAPAPRGGLGCWSPKEIPSEGRGRGPARWGHLQRSPQSDQARGWRGSGEAGRAVGNLSFLQRPHSQRAIFLQRPHSQRAIFQPKRDKKTFSRNYCSGDFLWPRTQDSFKSLETVFFC